MEMTSKRPRGGLAARVGRYATATVAGAGCNTGAYLVLIAATGWPAAVLNVVAAAVVIGPRFAANRYWVWRRPGTGGLRRELGVHLALTVAGVALGTIVAWLLDRAGATAPVLAGGQLVSYAVTWSIRFLLFERIYDPRRHRAPMGGSAAGRDGL